jgi:hypothetical protein
MDKLVGVMNVPDYREYLVVGGRHRVFLAQPLAKRTGIRVQRPGKLRSVQHSFGKALLPCIMSCQYSRGGIGFHLQLVQHIGHLHERIYGYQPDNAKNQTDH